ncbi:MAG: hypothetical protein R2881_10730 [Eubacteriales bacterium]
MISKSLIAGSIYRHRMGCTRIARSIRHIVQAFPIEKVPWRMRGSHLERAYRSRDIRGQSMGGYLVQSFLLRYPEMALAFVAIDTCPYGLRYYSKSDLLLAPKLAQSASGCHMDIMSIPSSRASALTSTGKTTCAKQSHSTADRFVN